MMWSLDIVVTLTYCGHMRKVGVRKFKDNFYAEIKDLPLIVTSDNRPMLVVTSPEKNKKDVVTSKKPETNLKKCAVKTCKNRGEVNCEIAGEKYHACPEHYEELKIQF